MKKFLKPVVLTIIFMAITLPAIAEENMVEVKKNDTIFNIYLAAHGNGYTLESAKSAAISTIVPQLIEKTKDLPGSIQQSMSTNGIEKGEGACTIAAKTLIQSYWKLEDGIYHYTIKLIVENSRDNNR